MFPFSYNKRITISIKGEQKMEPYEILMKFKEQFDNPKLKNSDTITFDNFNFYLKRHKWLDNGALTISKKENQLLADLTLRFYTTPVILSAGSIILVWMNRNDIWFALVGVAVFWTFYLFFFLWTTIMFRSTIRRTIEHQLFLAETGLDDDQRFIIVNDICPGCGYKLNPKDTECADCGLCFGGE